MKLTKYLLPVAFAAMTTACDTCDMDPVLPPVQAPDNNVILAESNMTILEFKQQYWSTQSNSMTQVGFNADGDSIILRGRVISTDITGNLYKQLVIRDETAAITIPLAVNDIYKVYPYGTEIAVKATGLYVGMYVTFMQLGAKEEDRTSPYQIPEDDADNIFFPNDWPDASEAQPLEVDLDFLRSSKSDATARQEWQSQLVTVNDVEFETPGQEFSPTYGSTVSQYIRDNNGNRLTLRFSGRSSFAHRIIPTGTGSITGILSFFNNDWQLIPCTLEDLKGFDEVTGGDKDPVVDAAFVPATSISDGKFVIWFEGNKVAVPFPAGYNYGWMNVDGCTAANGTITTSTANLFTFKKEAKGWTIVDSNGNYLYQNPGYDSFQLTTKPDAASDYTYWTITVEANGSFTIVNCGTGKTMLYSPQFNSCGAYADLSKGTAPYLYQPAK